MKEKKLEKRTRFLDEIITTLSNKTMFFECKTGWNNFWMLSDEALVELSKSILNIKNTIINASKNSLKEVNETKKKLIEHNEYRKEDIKSDFSITYKEKENKYVIGVPENNLERLIALTLEEKDNNLKVINQIPTSDCGHIDLYCQNNKEINIIELKQWDSNDNPLFAIVELLKNYYLLFYSHQNKPIIEHFNICKENKKINLILLAPIEYYEYFYKEKTLTNFLKLIEMLNKKLIKKEEIEINIQLKYLNIERTTIENKVDTKRERNSDWRNYISDFKAEEKKAFCDWKDISKIDKWPKSQNK